MQDPDASLMLLDDFVHIFKHKIDSNERPYQRQAKEYFNSLVDEWCTVISPILINSKRQVIVKRAYDTLVLLTRGKELRALYSTDFKERFKRQSKEDIQFFVDFILETNIDKLVVFGRNTIQKIWITIVTYLTDHRDHLQYKRIYNGSENPEEWIKRESENYHLFSQEKNPFGLDDEKLSSIKSRLDVVLAQYPKDF